MAIDYTGVQALTFDCYGTLIDWEAGLTEAFRRVLGTRGANADVDDVLTRYARHEAAAEAGPYLTYRDVLATGLRGVADELGFEPTADEVAAFSGSVEEWPAFTGLGGGPREAQAAVPPRRHHQLRRRPVRGVEPTARHRLRLDRHRPAGRVVQTR